MDGFKNGFFINSYQNLRNGLKSDDIETFSKLSDNTERIKFIYNVSKIEEKLELSRHDREQKHRLKSDDEIYFYKDLNCAMGMKTVGNKFFQNQKWNEALNFYNKSYIMIPSDSCKLI